MNRYQHILAAIDFSEISARVVECARELAEAYDARLTLLHVVENTPLGLEPFGETSSLYLAEELRLQQINDAQTNIQALMERFQLPLSVAPMIEEGFATDTILAFAKNKHVDLIVIAHSGKKGFLGFLGSTANAVVKSAHCDVWVVRHRET